MTTTATFTYFPFSAGWFAVGTRMYAFKPVYHILNITQRRDGHLNYGYTLCGVKGTVDSIQTFQLQGALSQLAETTQPCKRCKKVGESRLIPR